MVRCAVAIIMLCRWGRCWDGGADGEVSCSWGAGRSAPRRTLVISRYSLHQWLYPRIDALSCVVILALPAELRYSSSLASSRAVEVASLAGSGVEPSTLSLLVIDRYGSTAGSKNVSTCLYHAPSTLNSGGKMQFWVCDDAVTGAGKYNLDMVG